MKCKHKSNNIFQLENGSVMTFVDYVKEVQGKEYFIAKDSKTGNKKVFRAAAYNDVGQFCEVEEVN